ncbi:uncharacterized protein [Rutidosis leptorrhynchoides]|uniref:uncharacterized protein n=1 Tax=Rutidosis leptorrhynchoides TaxID=125765 RepID=UPI003A999C08
MIKDMFFHGLLEENPFEHIQHLNDICDIYKTKNVSDDAFKLRAFPFTLQGEEKVWLRTLSSHSIRSFQDLTDAFINHFFPPSKVQRLRMEINGFTQRGDESLYDAWVHFKKLLRAFPPHGLTKKEYINTFYRGTNALTRQYLDSSSGGVFMYKSPNAAEILLEDVLVNTYEWAPSPRDLTRKSVAQVESDDGQITLASLNNQFQMYEKELKKLQQSIVTMQVGCQRCEGPHLTKNCPQINQCNHIDLDDIPINSDAHVNYVRIEDPCPQPFITQEPLPSFIEEEIGVNKEKDKENVDSMRVKDDKGKEKGKDPLKVNLPITDVLKGMPNYGGFIKELISQRGKYHEETSFFIEEACNKILASRLRIPKKLGDPGKFVFPCKFDDSEVSNALANLGESINLMPHSLYERLGFRPLKLT